MLKRLVITLLTIAGWMLPRPCLAQFIGYTSPQSTQQNFTPSGPATCTGSLQTFAINNLGQTSHLLNWVNSPSAINFTIQLSGAWDGVNFHVFSNVAHDPSGILQATGYYPQLRAEVICTSGSTFTLSYSGTSTFALQPIGFADRAAFELPWEISAGAGANQTNSLTVPYGTSGGLIYFQYGAAGEPAGSTLTVTANLSNVPGSITLLNAVPIAQNTNLQAWILPNIPSVQITLTYTSGGASASVFTSQVEFYKPGVIPYSADPCKFTGVATQISNCPTLP